MLSRKVLIFRKIVPIVLAPSFSILSARKTFGQLSFWLLAVVKGAEFSVPQLLYPQVGRITFDLTKSRHNFIVILNMKRIVNKYGCLSAYERVIG